MVALIECRQCRGDGFIVNSFNQTRRCGACKGKRVVPADKYDDWDARMSIFEAIKTLPRREEYDARNAFARLEESEPARYAKALESARAGRLDAVVGNLVTYWREINS